MPTFTVLTDLHLKPAYTGIADDVTLPAETDAVLIAGDLLDRADPESIDHGREFLRRLDESPVPTAIVPGNHDPLDATRTLIAEYESVQLAHERTLTADSFPGPATPFADVAVVGIGCTQFDAGREIPYEQALAFAFRDEYGRVDDYREARAVDQILRLLDDVVAGTQSSRDMYEEVGLPPTAIDAIEDVAATAQSLIDRLSCDGPTILLSHVPPFGTDLDVHHSQEDRHEDGLHDGWLALAAAIRQAAPTVAVAGHSHVRGYARYDSSSTHVLDGGFRGITTVEVGAEGFSFSFHDPDWLPGEG
ncbi:metallophosphoesterase family protein [Halobaculum sp. EA56]|uniref:metallophosphoesterase family protein n=1 Tax=Halobaculum sp. EA56 TaxID=3421648 RepID=UPI003EB9B1E3